MTLGPGPAGRWANAEEGRREGLGPDGWCAALPSFALVVPLWDPEREPSSQREAAPAPGDGRRGGIGPSALPPLEGASPRQCGPELSVGLKAAGGRIRGCLGDLIWKYCSAWNCCLASSGLPPPLWCSDVAAASLGLLQTSCGPTTGHGSPGSGDFWPGPSGLWAAVVNIRRAPRVGSSVCRWVCLSRNL